MAWWDGRPLGPHRLPVPTADQAAWSTWSDTAILTVPAELRGPGPHTVAVLVRRMAHEEDGGASDAFKSARGPTAVTLDGTPPTWRIQGAAGADPVRGPLDTGGLYGERHGWHLPGYPDRSWQPVTLPPTDTRQGVARYRTEFRLSVDPGTDASLDLTFTDDPSRPYRVQIFLNGWKPGQYVDDVGPQRTFVLFVLSNGSSDPMRRQHPGPRRPLRRHRARGPAAAHAHRAGSRLRRRPGRKGSLTGVPPPLSALRRPLDTTGHGLGRDPGHPGGRGRLLMTVANSCATQGHGSLGICPLHRRPPAPSPPKWPRSSVP
ncbi:beta galactosidase jelly roll domain-containing protein [Streptomyces thermoviolaceus]|uniref:beta galactosidase jelly roll domain-containing protein n=1 Tax=Streptomyces thermoviolaceus TaxID=1952 RepID=UPI0033A70923